MATRRAELEAAGFAGFVRFAELPTSPVPQGPGVYVIVRAELRAPEFRANNPAGWFKGKDPTVPGEKLQSAWVEDVEVVYIGNATGGRDGRRGLSRRLEEYRRHGAGEPVGHWGADTSGSWPTPRIFSSRGERHLTRVRVRSKANSSRPFATEPDHSPLQTSIGGVGGGCALLGVEHRLAAALRRAGCSRHLGRPGPV